MSIPSDPATVAMRNRRAFIIVSSLLPWICGGFLTVTYSGQQPLTLTPRGANRQQYVCGGPPAADRFKGSARASETT